MHRIEVPRLLRRQTGEFRRDDFKPRLFKVLEDLAEAVFLHAVGFDNREGLLNGKFSIDFLFGRLRCFGGDFRCT